MNMTAMENTSQPNPAAAASEACAGTMRQVWWASLGLLAVVDEKSGRLVDTLIQKGKEFEPSVKECFKKAGKEISDATEAVGTQIKGLGEKVGKAPAQNLIGAVEEKISATVKRMGIPSKDEIQSLNRKVDELGTKVEELLAKLGQSTRQPGA